MKKRNFLSRLIAAVARTCLGMFPGLYILMNRLNSAVLRNSFKDISQNSLLNFWECFHFVSLPTDSYRHFGDKADGGYFLAVPINENSEVVSIGLGDNISFDHAVSPFVARIHLFDHTINVPQNIPRNATYYDRGLGVTSSEELLDLQSILDYTDQKSPKILKIDIEGAEWDVLQSLTIDSLLGINQLIVEFHNLLEIVRNPISFKKATQVLEFIKKDYWAININPNNWANTQIIHGVAFADVLEVTFLRKDAGTVVVTETLSVRGFPNNPEAPKLLLGNFDQIFR